MNNCQSVAWVAQWLDHVDIAQLFFKLCVVSSNHLGDIIQLMHLVRGDRDSRANLMPIYGDLYQIKL